VIRSSENCHVALPSCLLGEGGPDGGVVVSDLPLSADVLPHVGEARVDSRALLALALIAEHEGVHAGVEVGIGSEGLDLILSDGAEGDLLQEVDEVTLGILVVLDEEAGNRGKEGELVAAGAGVELGNLDVVLRRETIVNI
jgi:hypothetical protein